MYRRDLLTAEIQKLAQALARIIGLKQQGLTEEAEEGIDQMLLNDFGILFSDLILVETTDFTAFLTGKDYPAEKLDILSQLLYLRFDPAIVTVENKSVAEKLQLIYQTLEIKHRVINMINLDRQKNTGQYLKINS
ncbi:MAG TPA: hypothetical protein VGC08_09075 [Pedobacter sp.]